MYQGCLLCFGRSACSCRLSSGPSVERIRKRRGIPPPTGDSLTWHSNRGCPNGSQRVLTALLVVVAVVVGRPALGGDDPWAAAVRGDRPLRDGRRPPSGRPPRPTHQLPRRTVSWTLLFVRARRVSCPSAWRKRRRDEARDGRALRLRRAERGMFALTLKFSCILALRCLLCG